MQAHVSSILLGVQDMDRSKRFYAEGLGWKVQNDYAEVPPGDLRVGPVSWAFVLWGPGC